MICKGMEMTSFWDTDIYLKHFRAPNIHFVGSRVGGQTAEGVLGPPPGLEKYWERVTEGSRGEGGTKR